MSRPRSIGGELPFTKNDRLIAHLLSKRRKSERSRQVVKVQGAKAVSRKTLGGLMFTKKAVGN